MWQGHEAGRPLPLEADYMAAVTNAVAANDVDMLLKLEEQERNSHARELLLQTVANALKALESVPRATGPEEEEGGLPAGYDRAETLKHLKARKVTVPADATDEQLVAMWLTIAEGDAA
jgi:hypothetical protein